MQAVNMFLDDMEAQGAPTDLTLKLIGQEAGIGCDLAREKVQGVLAGFKAQAEAHLQAAGVDPAAFVAWASENDPKGFLNAQRQHAKTRSPGQAYGAMVEAYTAHSAAPAVEDISDDDVLGAEFGSGISAMRASNGKVYLYIPGRGQVEYGAALKSGLLKITHS